MKAPVAAVAALVEEGFVSPPPVIEPDVSVAPYNTIIDMLKTKKKYLEVRAEKLQKFEAEVKMGKVLPDEKEKARLCLPDVKNQIGFISTFQKKIVEKQHEFNRKNKQRKLVFIQEKDQLAEKTCIDVLTARYILGQFTSHEGKRHIADSFTSDERSNLERVALFFNPEITRGDNIRGVFTKNVNEITAILRKNEKKILWGEKDNTFSAADAYNLLETLMSVLDGFEESVTEPVDTRTELSVVPEDPEVITEISSVTSEKQNSVEVLPNSAESKTEITFGYFSDTSNKKEEDSLASTDITAGETSEAPSTDIEKASKKKESNKVEKRERTKRPRHPKKNFKKNSDTLSQEKPSNQVPEQKIENTKPKERSVVQEKTTETSDKEKTDRPRFQKKENNGNNKAPRQNGIPRGVNYNNGQKRANGSRENGTEDDSQTARAENAARPPRYENVARPSRTGYTKNYNGNKTNGYNGHLEQRNGYSNGNYSGYKRDYNPDSRYKVPTGYERHGDVVRPLPGNCGFTFLVKS